MAMREPPEWQSLYERAEVRAAQERAHASIHSGSLAKPQTLRANFSREFRYEVTALELVDCARVA